MIKEAIKLINTLEKSKLYINNSIFRQLCDKSNVSYREYRDKYFQSPPIIMLNELPEGLITAIVEFTLENDLPLHTYYSPKVFQSYDDNFKFLAVFKKKTGEVLTEELELSKVIDLQKILSLYKEMITDENDEFMLLRLLDVIYLDNSSKEKKTVKIYDGDVFITYDRFSNDTKVYVAKIRDKYIHDRPYYKELLWSDKYGYFTPKAELNEDSNRYIFEEGSLNIDDKNYYNDYCLRLKSEFKRIGNVYYDVKALIIKPVINEDVTKDGNN